MEGGADLMGGLLTPQANPDVARLRKEVERLQQNQTLRLRGLEEMEAYIRDTLYPYLVGLAAAVAHPPPPRPPS